MNWTDIIIFLLVPVFTEVVKRWTALHGDRAFILALIVSVLGGLASVVIGGGLGELPKYTDPTYLQSLATFVAAVFTVSQIVYRALIAKLPTQE
jgi:hypothetical protein